MVTAFIILLSLNKSLFAYIIAKTVPSRKNTEKILIFFDSELLLHRKPGEKGKIFILQPDASVFPILRKRYSNAVFG